MRLGIAIGTSRLPAVSDGGSELPIARRDVLQEDGFFVMQEDGTSKIVISFGTFDSLALETGIDLLLQEDTSKIILIVN